jgi:hypothetical protein
MSEAKDLARKRASYPHLYLSEERSARFLSRRERFNAPHTRDAYSCTQTEGVARTAREKLIRQTMLLKTLRPESVV